MTLLFIGDVIAQQIGMNRGEVVSSRTSHDLPSLSDLDLSLEDIGEVYYCLGFADVIQLGKPMFDGFRHRVREDIEEILNLNLPLTLVIPPFLEDGEEEIDKEYHNKVKSALRTFKDLSDEYDLQQIDLQEIVSPQFVTIDGLSAEGQKEVAEFFDS